MRIWKAIWDFEWGMAAIGAGICLFAMMMITVISVFGRYFLHADLIPGAYNIVERVVFPLMVFWALPLAHREGMFPRLEGMTDALAPWTRALVDAVVLLVEVLIYAFILWLVLRFVWDSIKTNRPMQLGADFWPLWPILIMMPLAFGLMLLEMIRLFWRDVRRVLGLDPAVDDPEQHGSSAV